MRTQQRFMSLQPLAHCRPGSQSVGGVGPDASFAVAYFNTWTIAYDGDCVSKPDQGPGGWGRDWRDAKFHPKDPEQVRMDGILGAGCILIPLGLIGSCAALVSVFSERGTSLDSAVWGFGLLAGGIFALYRAGRIAKRTMGDRSARQSSSTPPPE